MREIYSPSLLIPCLFLLHGSKCTSPWSEWWTYDGFAGPMQWGILNPEWGTCNKGKNQSPIDINPETLLYDPQLEKLKIHGSKISANVTNHGHDVTFVIGKGVKKPVTITEGPLSYTYQIKQIKLHFGSDDDRGSEHLINGKAFPAELQILAFNSDLYDNFSLAEKGPKGIAIIAVFIGITEHNNGALDQFIKVIKDVRIKGESSLLKNFKLHNIIPQCEQYMTYDGSLTYPACHETVTWIVMNRPIYISHEQMAVIRELNQGGHDNPQMLMANNYRPAMDIHHRSVRTNINFKHGCNMAKTMKYQVNVAYKN